MTLVVKRLGRLIFEVSTKIGKGGKLTFDILVLFFWGFFGLCG